MHTSLARRIRIVYTVILDRYSYSNSPFMSRRCDGDDTNNNGDDKPLLSLWRAAKGSALFVVGGIIILPKCHNARNWI